jgi:thioesterase domain-containing protein
MHPKRNNRQKPEAEGDEPDAEADEEAETSQRTNRRLPAIDPPNSLTAEEKETFKSLPREAQEFTARRIGELEKGFQTKAQEAAQAKHAAQLEALKIVEQIKAQAAEQLQAYAQQFEVKPPSAALFTQNPEAYAQQLEAYQYYTAQRESAQRDADKARAEQAQINGPSSARSGSVSPAP